MDPRVARLSALCVQDSPVGPLAQVGYSGLQYDDMLLRDSSRRHIRAIDLGLPCKLERKC